MEIIFLGTEAALDNYVLQMINMMKLQAEQPQLLCKKEEDWPESPVGYQVIDNVAVISVNGETANETTIFTRYFGIPTYEDIRERLVEAFDDAPVRSVMLKMATGGGTSAGCPALGEFIGAYTSSAKPIVSYTNSSAASAAMLYGTAATGFLADSYASVGSIGAVARHVDLSKMYEAMGIKNTLIRSGPYKAVPNHLEKLDDKGMEVLKAGVDRWHNIFVDVLSKNLRKPREQVQSKLASGKMFPAQDALNLGLIDGISTFDNLVATMRTKYQNINATGRAATLPTR